MWIRPRKIVAQWLGQDPEVPETPAPPPTVCAVCSREGHDRDACPGIIRTPADAERTWGNAGGFSGRGDSFDLIADFYARFRGE